MRVLYLTTRPLDEASPRGRLGAMPFVFRSAGIEVIQADRLCQLRRRVLSRTAQLASRGRHEEVAWDRSRPLLYAYASAVKRAQRHCRADAVVVGESTIVAHACLDVPVVTWTDSVFGGMVGYNPAFTGLSKGTLRRGNCAERSALHRATAAVFLSDWAAEQARSLYGVPPAKIHVVPFGGVLASPPASAEVFQSIKQRSAQREVRLLWMGRDWIGKGGDLAVQTAEILRARGHEVRLTLIGMAAPEAVRRLPWVQSLGFLRRSSEVDRERLFSTFLTSHVHLLPTRAECMGLALAEASAYGVPSVVTSTGGTSSAVVNGITGFLIREGSEVERYAEAVERIVVSPEEFMRYALQAHQDYVDRLSYPVIGRQMLQILESITGGA